MMKEKLAALKGKIVKMRCYGYDVSVAMEGRLISISKEDTRYEISADVGTTWLEFKAKDVTSVDGADITISSLL